MDSGSYSHSTFVTQSRFSDRNVCMDRRQWCVVSHDAQHHNMYNVSPPPTGREAITNGDKRRLSVEYVGNIGVVFHGYTDERSTRFDVA